MNCPRLAIAAAVLAGTSFVAACGSDNASATHDEWFASACEAIGDGDPGFDKFFAEHAEPTLDDWAEFLPGVIAVLDRVIDATELPHPSSDDAKLAKAAKAVGELRDDFKDALAAAKKGDQAAFDAAEEGRDAHSTAMEEAMQAVDERDCSELTG